MANESYSVYPDGIDGYASLPLRRDGIHEIVAADHNRLRDAIVKIEQELGVQPSGTFGTVSARLDNIGDARAIILAHMADTTDAHDASAISVLDTDDHFFEIDVEGALEELSVLLPDAPDELGEDNSRVPNDAIPSFFDGYGTKFVYNTSSSDSIHKKTQPSAIAGLRGVHIVEVGAGCDDGYALLRMSGGEGLKVLEFFAPGDVDYGNAVSIEVSEGTPVKLESYDTTKKIIVTRNSIVLSRTSPIEEGFEIYSANFQPGYWSLPSEGFKFTQHISRTATTIDGTSRLQCMISGTIFPADRGTLVLQRKTRGVLANPSTGDDGFWPVAVLDLSANFDETKRTTGQPVYVPGMTLFDTITLYERHSVKEDYTTVASNADGVNPYDDYANDYARMQLAKYVIPISNSEIIGGTVSSPPGITEVNADDEISWFRIFHFKEGIISFIDDPDADQVYGMYDTSHPTSANDGNTPVSFSNIYFDDSPTRPGVELLNLRPQYPDARLSTDEDTVEHKFLSGVKYYHSPTDRFDVELRSDNNVFNKTYVVNGILTFETDVFDFPAPGDPNVLASDGGFGASVDIQELTDDGYFKWGSGNLPDHEDQTYYIIDKVTPINGLATNEDRQLRVAPDRFSNHSWIQATLHDPFGPGDGYDAYGAEDIHRILVNSYSITRATDAIEYFTDESKRRADTMVFIAGAEIGDGYTLEYYEKTVLTTTSLQVGGRFTDDEFNIAGLIYPQTNYHIVKTIRPTQSESSMDYSILQGHRQYQRLFSLGYPISRGRLRIVSDGNSPISFNDIWYGNLDRFGKIEIKVPGHGANSTEWLDISKLFSTGEYENGYGSMYGVHDGTAGDFTVPFTLGQVNTADDHGYDMDYAIAVRVTYFGDDPDSDRKTKLLQASRQKIMTMIQLLP